MEARINMGDELRSELNELRNKVDQLSQTLIPMASDIAAIKQRLDDGNRRFDTLPCPQHIDNMRRIEEKLNAVLVENAKLTQTVDTLRLVVYGAVGMSLLSMGGALIALILKSGVN